MSSPNTAVGLSGLRCLVVGGSGGIGLALSLELARGGASLTLHGRDAARLGAAAEAVRRASPEAAPPKALACPVEPRGELLPGALLAAARECDALALCYGPFLHAAVAETGPADWAFMAAANLAFPAALAAEAAKAMAGRGFGRILLFGGTRTDAIRAYRRNAAYAAAKTGLAVAAKSIAAEFAPLGVSCALVCPGYVDTEYLDAAFRASMERGSPRGRLIAASRVAKFAARLLEGGMDLANGAVINLDEGLA